MINHTICRRHGGDGIASLDGVDRVDRVDVLATLDGDCFEELCFLIASYAHSYHIKRDQDKIHYSRK